MNQTIVTVVRDMRLQQPLIGIARVSMDKSTICVKRMPIHKAQFVDILAGIS